MLNKEIKKDIKFINKTGKRTLLGVAICFATPKALSSSPSFPECHFLSQQIHVVEKTIGCIQDSSPIFLLIFFVTWHQYN